MYNKVESAGFTKELTEDFIERYQGNYVLTEDGVDYLVTPKSIGKYELDTDNFWLTARKGDMDITINIDENRKIFLALYPGEIEVDEKGNVIDTSNKLTDVQKEHMDDLLTNRKEEILQTMPKRYNGISRQIFRDVREQVIFPLWLQHEQLLRDGLGSFGVEVNVVENGTLVPMEIEVPDRFKNKDKNGQER